MQKQFKFGNKSTAKDFYSTHLWVKQNSKHKFFCENWEPKIASEKERGESTPCLATSLYFYPSKHAKILVL